LTLRDTEPPPDFDRVTNVEPMWWTHDPNVEFLVLLPEIPPAEQVDTLAPAEAHP